MDGDSFLFWPAYKPFWLYDKLHIFIPLWMPKQGYWLVDSVRIFDFTFQLPLFLIDD